MVVSAFDFLYSKRAFSLFQHPPTLSQVVAVALVFGIILNTYCIHSRPRAAAITHYFINDVLQHRVKEPLLKTLIAAKSLSSMYCKAVSMHLAMPLYCSGISFSASLSQALISPVTC